MESGTCHTPAAATMAVHQLPAEVLHLIMALLPPNGAVLLGGLHPDLRAALATLPQLHVALTLDAVDRHTRGAYSTDATSIRLRQQEEGFSTFLAASPCRRVTQLKLTVRVSPTMARPNSPSHSAALDLDWLHLSDIRKVNISTAFPVEFRYSQPCQLTEWLCGCLRQTVSACSALQSTLVCDSLGSFETLRGLQHSLPPRLPCLELDHRSSDRQINLSSFLNLSKDNGCRPSHLVLRCPTICLHPGTGAWLHPPQRVSLYAEKFVLCSTTGSSSMFFWHISLENLRQIQRCTELKLYGGSLSIDSDIKSYYTISLDNWKRRQFTAELRRMLGDRFVQGGGGAPDQQQ